ncbi:MAG: GTPase HflX [Filifactoraceae bacterium]
MEDIIEKIEYRGILVGLHVTDQNKPEYKVDLEPSMKELKELSNSAGIEVLGTLVQNRPSVDVTYYIGKGKTEEIRELANSMEANIIIFNNELSGAQIRNLENEIGVSIIDRTMLILDIFAKRALTHEGRLQVELAQLKYRLPRLKGMGENLSRTGSGIGARGPGEKKLETDRRHIKSQIYEIQQELKEIVKNREIQRGARIKAKLPIIALVGYTNAGKSTLTNVLMSTHKNYEDSKKVFVKDMLFATLDISLRKGELPNGEEYLLTDTVGFVSDLPHDLVEAFKATLEEISFADLLVHVIDASNVEYKLQIDTTLNVLKELGVEGKPIINVFNKVDKIDYEKNFINLDNKVYISAKNGYNVNLLLEKIQEEISNNKHIVTFKIPFERGDIVNYLHKNYKVADEDYIEDGIIIRVSISVEDKNRLAKFIIEG